MRVRMANSDGWDLIIARRDRRAGDKSRQTTHEKSASMRQGEARRGVVQEESQMHMCIGQELHMGNETDRARV